MSAAATTDGVYAIPRIVCAATHKQAYISLVRAERARQRVELVTGCVYRIYVCEFCTTFHLTSQARRAWRA